MLLSIGMIVKNEEKYLEQCLTGVKPILDNIDSELIIADTGSTDRTVEIAKKFTDNVFYFEWINDFAAARNSTLEKSRGEWFMFVDGDEVFTSCDNIIGFFSSGEYKKFNAASFVIRNLLPTLGDNTNTHYDDFSAPRLTKIQPHTRFSGLVHESLNTYMPPIKKLNDIALHYGYLYEDDAEMQAKMKRNIDLLEKKLEGAAEKALPQLYLQLYESYVNLSPETAYDYLEKGIELSKKNNDIILIALYCDKAQDALAKGNYERAINTCNDYFEMDKSVRPYALTSDAEIYAIQASANYNTENYDVAIASYIKFFETYKLIKSDKLTTFDSYLLAYSIACDRNFIPLLNEFVYCCSHTGKYNLASAYLTTLPIDRYSEIDGHVTIIVNQIISVMSHLDYQSAKQYYKKLNEFGKKKFREFLCIEAFRTDTPLSVISALADVAEDDAQLSEKMPILSKYFNGEEVSESELCNYSDKYPIDKNAEIMFIALKQGNDITKLFESPNYDMKLTVYMGYITIYGFVTAVEDYNIERIKNVDSIPTALKFYEYCMKTVPLYRSPKQGEYTIYTVEELFCRYAELGKRYAKEKGAAVNDLEGELKAAYIAGSIIQTRNEKRYKDCFSAMKNAVHSYGGIAAVIEEYQKIVVKEYENSINNMSEMDRLAEQIKRNIRNFIVSGNYDAARKTLDQYKQINPNDKDIIALENLTS